jgi:hypothetical protein
MGGVRSKTQEPKELPCDRICNLDGIGYHGLSVFVAQYLTPEAVLYLNSHVRISKTERRVIELLKLEIRTCFDTYGWDQDAGEQAMEKHLPWLSKHAGHDLDRDYRFVSSYAWAAAKTGHLQVLRWIHANGYPLDSHVCSSAADGGHIAVMRWARSVGCKWGTATIGAAWGGHFHILKWMNDEGCYKSVSLCSSLAYTGQLHILKWARANGWPWNEKTCLDAATKGHLKILKWARANDCPWDRERCERAALNNGKMRVWDWIQEEPSTIARSGHDFF